jgi:hypothetical protein
VSSISLEILRSMLPIYGQVCPSRAQSHLSDGIAVTTVGLATTASRVKLGGTRLSPKKGPAHLTPCDSHPLR